MVLHIIRADILLFARNYITTQLAKYPRVLYVKPSNKIYLSTGAQCVKVLISYYSSVYSYSSVNV